MFAKGCTCVVENPNRPLESNTLQPVSMLYESMSPICRVALNTVLVNEVLLYLTVIVMAAVSLLLNIISLTCLLFPDDGLETNVTAVVLLLAPLVSYGIRLKEVCSSNTQEKLAWEVVTEVPRTNSLV